MNENSGIRVGLLYLKLVGKKNNDEGQGNFVRKDSRRNECLIKSPSDEQIVPTSVVV